MWKYLVLILYVGTVMGRNLPMPSSGLDPLREVMTITCSKNGHPEAIEKAVEGTIRYSECIKYIYDVRELHKTEDSDPTVISSSFISFFQSVCKKKDDFLMCYYALLDSVEPCMEPYTTAQKIKNIMSNFTSFVCDNEGGKFGEFVDDGGIRCMLKRRKELSECIPKIPLKLSERPLTYAEICVHFKEMTDCVLSTLKECPKPSTAEFISKIIDVLDGNYQCQRAIIDSGDRSNNSDEDDKHET